MSYLIFKEKGLAVGAKKVAEQCTSAIFNYQVIGAGATVEFSGSNKPDYDIDDETHWQLIYVATGNTADSEPFRQHAWDNVRLKVTAGSNVEVYVSSGVSGQIVLDSNNLIRCAQIWAHFFDIIIDNIQLYLILLNHHFRLFRFGSVEKQVIYG